MTLSAAWRPLLIGLVVGTVASGAAMSAETAPIVKPKPKPVPARPVARATRFTVDLPVTIDGIASGTLLVALIADRIDQIHAESWRTLARGRVAGALIERIAAQADANGFVPIHAFAAENLLVRYEPSTLTVKMELDEQTREVNALSLRSGSGAGSGEATPGPLSAYVNVRAAQSFVSESPAGAGRRNAAVVLDGAVRLFGARGATLEWSAGYLEGERKPLQRGEVRLLADDVPNAIRYTLGDLNYGATEFQGSPGLLGFSMERQFGRLQPFRVVTATGQQSFTLTRPSRIEVYVNGQFQNATQLRPGRYSLSDFAFLTGLNDVQIIVEDDTGQRRQLDFTLFLGAELLAPGVSLFSFNAGVQRQQFADTIQYQFDAPAISSFARIGITQWLTGGLNWQAERGLIVAGADSVIGTPIGIFGLAASRSRVEDGAIGWAGSLRWTYNFGLFSDVRTQELDFAGVYTTADYRQVGQGLFALPFEIQSVLRFTSQLPLGAAFSVTGRYARPQRSELADERGLGLSLSKRFGFLSVNLRGDYLVRDDEELRGFVTLSIPLRGRQNVISSYDTISEDFRTDYSLFSRDLVGDLSGRVGVAANDRRYAFSGDTTYRANRYLMRGQYNVSQPRIGDRDRDRVQSGTVQFESALAYSDGAFAIGRPVADSFAIVERHESLKRTDVNVLGSGFSGKGAVARADDGGPALVPNIDSFRDQRIEWTADDPPPGYDLGNTARVVNPAFRSGYRYMVGSAASVTAVGIARLASGKPVDKVAASVEAADGRSFATQRSFTNKAGRFAIAQLSPGRYRVTFATTPKTIIEFAIAEDALGLVDLGSVIARELP